MSRAPGAKGDTELEEPFSEASHKRSTSLSLGFLFCKMGMFTAIYRDVKHSKAKN